MPGLNPSLGKFLPGQAAIAVAAIATIHLPGKAYPACDNSLVRAELAGLYDNKRLLHAFEFSNLRLLGDAMFARHCAVTVKWGDGSVSDVDYEFYRSGRRSGYVSLWIGYNGGMRGPSF